MNPEQWDERPDVLDEKAETWGPGSDEPIPYVPVDDDTMAGAEAVGVTPMDPALLVDWHLHGPALSDTSLAETLAAWSHAAAGAGAEPLTDEWYAEWDALLAKPGLPDHADCEGPDCDQTICCCPADVRCEGTVEQECPHHSLLCGECRPECVDCRIDAQDGAA